MDKNEQNIVKINKNDLGEIGNIISINNTLYYEKYYERNPDYNYKTNNTVKEYITNLYTLSSDGTGSQKLNHSYSRDINAGTDSVYYHKYFHTGSMNADIRTKIKKDGRSDIDVSKFVENASSNNTGDTNSSTDSLIKLTADCTTVTRDSNNSIVKITLNSDMLKSILNKKCTHMFLLNLWIHFLTLSPMKNYYLQ